MVVASGCGQIAAASVNDARGFDREALLSKAVAPMLRYRSIKPVRLVKIVPDKSYYQGWAVKSAGGTEDAYGRRLKQDDEIIFDFGEHLVGRFSIAIDQANSKSNSKLQLQFSFAEMPCELGEAVGTAFKGTISPSWVQRTTIVFEDGRQAYTLPDRYAFRYVRVRAAHLAPGHCFAITSVGAVAESSADCSKVSDCAGLTGLDRRIYEVAAATLRDSMQTVLEDGPKRDRRLWLGDLRLQALANYKTFRNYDVVKRSLYLCAGCAFTNGMTATAVFERPTIENAGSRILDYTALFGTTVLEYMEASGDMMAVEDLWPCVKASAKAVIAAVDESGLVKEQNGWWNFIDWQDGLNRQASEQGAIIFGLKRTLELAGKLGRTHEVDWIGVQVAKMEKRAVEALWDRERNLWISGAERNVSWMSQAYLSIAEVGTLEMRRMAILNVRSMKNAVRPRTPYAYHYFAMGMDCAGMKNEALELVRDYWGGMVQKGADTFWEVYDPEDDRCSPYKAIILNSYCHAWSCAPLCFLGK